MNWDDLAAAYKGISVETSATPIYGILNTFNGRRLDKTFDSFSAAQDHIKEQRLSHFFRVIVVGRIVVK